MTNKDRIRVLKRNKVRYLAMVVGFFLLVAPFAFLTNAIFDVIGNTATPTLHTFCFRNSFVSLAVGNFNALFISVAAWLVLSVLVVAVVAGPLFCGYMCPVGAASEGLSRIVPIPKKAKVKLKDPKVTRSIRYGFLAGFFAVAVIVGYKMTTDVGSICCRYCSASPLQNFSTAFTTGNLGLLANWTSSGLIVLMVWLVIGGVLLVGGRGWCLFFCPLGAVSGLAHAAGSKMGFYKTSFNEHKCKDCKQCTVTCPMQAIAEDGKVEDTLCIGCHECVNNCNFKAYSYGRGIGEDKPKNN
jgi:ferredoxin-type protein NapH